jgi:hypothetical protein
MVLTKEDLVFALRTRQAPEFPGAVADRGLAADKAIAETRSPIVPA